MWKKIKQKSQIRTIWLEMNPSLHFIFESKIYITHENVNILIKSKGDWGAIPRKWPVYSKCQCFVHRMYVCLCIICEKGRSTPISTSFLLLYVNKTYLERCPLRYFVLCLVIMLLHVSSNKCLGNLILFPY